MLRSNLLEFLIEMTSKKKSGLKSLGFFYDTLSDISDNVSLWSHCHLIVTHSHVKKRLKYNLIIVICRRNQNLKKWVKESTKEGD